MLIKEFTVHNGQNRMAVRQRNYAHNLAHLNSLYEAAKADFPDLKPEDVDVCHYAGNRYRGTWGIEFRSDEDPPEEYQQRQRAELLLG